MHSTIKHYLDTHGYDRINLKAVFFDMDGVLYNSMPYHAEAWHQVMKQYGMNLSREEAYMHEGRTGAGTINIVSLRDRGYEASPEEIKEIYAEKSRLFNLNPPAEPMKGAMELLQQVKECGLMRVIVTGSGQRSLLDRLNSHFPDMFTRELMVTAFDVKYGKPNPEPYLMALKKAGVAPNEAIVVENAPLGVQAAVSAGIFTIAVNTGPLPESALLDEGADLLYPSMMALTEKWQPLLHEFQKHIFN
ncbi:MAG: HAD-IA family hydrolase [Bacteroidaceae bacterium]|nr:HAD-IA family hydrolase [Bacteroidaceae bacterium]MBR3896192.1 HAD-IA family hydrolase [Bacteroidaceae bacterium]